MQAASIILMIQPAAFGVAPQTCIFGSYSHLSPATIHQQALEEFDAMVNSLLQNNINVLVAGDTASPQKPAAVFPANWFCTNSNGVITVFPLQHNYRRAEKRDDILLALSARFSVNDVLDLSEYEAEGFFLEGTAGMVMDHNNKIIYSCIAPCTHKMLLQHFARYHGYRVMRFTTAENGLRSNYTNNILSIGDQFAVLCEAAIHDEFERIAIKQLLSTTHHTIIPVSTEQAQQFAANMIQVKNTTGDDIIILSQQAFNSLTREQLKKLHSFAKLVPVAIPTIESIGCNSVAGMVAPVFLSPK